MAKLQARAKPIVLALARGEIRSMDHADQTALAAWVCMVTVTGEYDTPEMTTISMAQRRWLADHLAPPLDTWRIWIAISDIQIPGFRAHHPVPIVSKEEAENEKLRFTSQTTTFTVGKLIAHSMSSYPDIVAGYQFPPELAVKLMRLWPPITEQLCWPLRHSIGDLSEHSAIADGFFNYCTNLPPRP